MTGFDSQDDSALEDFLALRCVYLLAQEHGFGQEMSLVPTDGNPKDLLGHTRKNAVLTRLQRVA